MRCSGSAAQRNGSDKHYSGAVPTRLLVGGWGRDRKKYYGTRDVIVGQRRQRRGMSPESHKVPLTLQNRAPAEAAVIDRCTAWVCACARPIPLIGHAGGATANEAITAQVACPACGRTYVVISNLPDHGRRVTEVVEVTLFGSPGQPDQRTGSGIPGWAGNSLAPFPTGKAPRIKVRAGPPRG